MNIEIGNATRVTEDDMVAAFLRAELGSKKLAPMVRERLERHRDDILDPDPSPEIVTPGPAVHADTG